MTTLYTARTIRTLDDEVPEASGVLVAGGRVVAVGDAPRLRRRAERVVDFADATIVPGLIDGHVHPSLGLATTAGVELTDMRSLDEVVAVLSAERERVGPHGWLRAWALNPVVFGGRPPSSAALGAAFESGPGFVLLYDGHSAVASPAALAAAGVDGPREFESSAEVAVDAAGAPTGYLLEGEASGLVERVIPKPGFEEQTRRLGEIFLEMARTGLTGIDVMDCEEPTLAALRALEERGDLPLRMNVRPWLGPEDGGIDGVLALQGERGRRWRVDGVKMFVDGTVDGGTAWLEYPDTCGQGLTPLWRDFGAFEAAAEDLHRAGVNLAVHAIGDRGVREVLALLDRLTEQYGAVARHRIEHIETLTDEVVREFGASRVAASMQPLHCTRFNTPDGSDTWSLRLSGERVENSFRWAEIRAAGGTLALGSDWPIAPFDPRWTMADAQLRRRYDRSDAEPMQPRQRLSPEQALEGYTTHAARASGEEDSRGRIRRGFLADFTVFGEDPLTAPPESMGENPVVATVIDGDVVG